MNTWQFYLLWAGVSVALIVMTILIMRGINHWRRDRELRRRIMARYVRPPWWPHKD